MECMGMNVIIADGGKYERGEWNRSPNGYGWIRRRIRTVP